MSPVLIWITRCDVSCCCRCLLWSSTETETEQSSVGDIPPVDSAHALSSLICACQNTHLHGFIPPGKCFLFASQAKSHLSVFLLSRQIGYRRKSSERFTFFFTVSIME